MSVHEEADAYPDPHHKGYIYMCVCGYGHLNPCGLTIDEPVGGVGANILHPGIAPANPCVVPAAEARFLEGSVMALVMAASLW